MCQVLYFDSIGNFSADEVAASLDMHLYVTVFDPQIETTHSSLTLSNALRILATADIDCIGYGWVTTRSVHFWIEDSDVNRMKLRLLFDVVTFHVMPNIYFKNNTSLKKQIRTQVLARHGIIE